MSDLALRRIAFVTCADLPELSADDRLALPALERRGVQVIPAVWTDPSVDWDRFDLVVIRSAWDYTERHAEFLAWLDRMERNDVPLWNPPALARWNADKRYLRGLQTAGVPVVPTRWLEAGDATPLAALLAAEGWERAVIKPVVSANARETWVAEAPTASAGEARFRAQLARAPAMVQPFVEEIRTEGEWSLLFFAGELSHALQKRPAAGDFRVQESHGGQSTGAVPDAELVVAAAAALDAVPGPWLFARVDGVRIAGRFHLMELEMLEPSLFLMADPERAPERFAEALVQACEVRPFQRMALARAG